jgi:hypothetical protein
VPVIEYVTVSGSAYPTPPPGLAQVDLANGAPPVPVDSGADPGRTANGLRKRPPRRTQPAPAQPHPTVNGVAGGRPAGEPVADSPEQVRARLTALRAGVRRGEDAREPRFSEPRFTGDTTDRGRDR